MLLGWSLPTATCFLCAVADSMLGRAQGKKQDTSGRQFPHSGAGRGADLKRNEALLNYSRISCIAAPVPSKSSFELFVKSEG